MTTAYLGVSITMFLLARSALLPGSLLSRLTPFEWENPHPCVEEPEELENELTLHNCFWHNWGSLMQQGSDIAPK
jgi:ionotropic kainate glutamate receptor 2